MTCCPADRVVVANDRAPYARHRVHLARGVAIANRASSSDGSPPASISGNTAAKQTVHHTDLKPDDYSRVQHILDEDEVFLEDDGRFADAFLEQDGQIWKAVVKQTGNGAEIYLTTLHRARLRDLRSAHRRFKLIER